MTITIVYRTLLAFINVPYILGHPLLGPPSLPTNLLPGVSSQKNVIVQLFQWNWNSIAQECREFIGPAGYGYVQVSPPAEHVEGNEWWTGYQPVSYKLESKHGSREEFANMVATCKAAGVKVVADTVLNHMAGSPSGAGVGRSSFSHYEYPGYYAEEDFHGCKRGISDYSNRDEVQNCELLGLADLATESDHVQHQLAAYIRDLLSLGVEGLRLDAAKHIPASDIHAILPAGKYYVTQEVTSGTNQAIKPTEYVGNGAVQVFDYTQVLMNAFLSGDIASLQHLDDRGWVPSDKANVFVANHDTERYGGSLNAHSPSNTYVLATVFSLAHPYGQNPTILSSYTFSNKDEGPPPNDGHGICDGDGQGGNGGWLCQHRLPAVAGMVGFRNMVGASEMCDWVAPERHRIAFGRRSLGHVAINNGDEPWSTKLNTSMPDGEYFNVIAGSHTDATSVQVADGRMDVTVPPRGALAIHMGSRRVPLVGLSSEN